jgi:hypothetical protein
MYGLTNFLSVLWHSVMGWFGLGRKRAHAVTLFDGDSDSPRQRYGHSAVSDDDDSGVVCGFSYDYDYRYTHPSGK